MILLKLNESSASLRVVPLPSLLSASNSTSAATNESGRTFYFSIGGVDYGSGGSLSAVSAAMGMYTCNFAASKISVTGPGFVYYGLPNSSLTALAVSAPFMVVPVDSYDSMRFGLFALPNVAAEAAGGLITRGTGTGQLHVSSGSVGIIADTHSGVTIKGIENYANISNVTLHAGTHSNVTIQGVSNYANFPLTSVATSVWSTLRSNFTTPGSFGEYTYSQVTGTSSGTVQGVTRALNLSANGDKTGYTLSAAGLADFFDTDSGTNYAGAVAGSVVKEIADNAGGSSLTEGQIARAVWANSGRTLDGDSTATIFVHPRSIWSTLRSAYTTPGSFGEYVYSQVTGTSTGTVKGVENYANISNVTLHAGTHSNVTIQGVTRVNSGVTLNANTHSGATIAGIVDGGIIASTLASGTITAAKFAAGAVDAAALATDAGQEIADRVLLRSIEGGADSGRSVGQALAPLRNRVLIEGSVGTVYRADDSTSLYTFSATTGTHPINSVDPTG